MIYLLRHGEIETGMVRRFVGQRDLPLTDLGERQAARWAEELAGIPFGRVMSSDLGRCRRFAELVAGRPPEELTALREISLGAWEGLTAEEVRHRFPGQYEARGRDLAGFRPEGGESFRDLAGRAWPAIDALADEDRDVLVVAHAGVNRTVICRALDIPLDHLLRLGQDYGSLNLLARREKVWQLVVLNLPPGGPLPGPRVWRQYMKRPPTGA